MTVIPILVMNTRQVLHLESPSSWASSHLTVSLRSEHPTVTHCWGYDCTELDQRAFLNDTISRRAAGSSLHQNKPSPSHSAQLQFLRDGDLIQPHYTIAFFKDSRQSLQNQFLFCKRSGSEISAEDKFSTQVFNWRHISKGEVPLWV